MEAAKQAVKNFTSKHGHHDTSVHEHVNPAVTQETVNRQQEDRITTATDKEVHQDHYHTSVQPVNHAETLAEKHHHRMGNVEERNFNHEDETRSKERHAAEATKFRDTTERVEGHHTQSIQPSVAGEHVHHHVHEQIQPVVNKQTVEPHVVHTTVPIHETHHNKAQHHGTSTLPPVSLGEFQQQGGPLEGRGIRSDNFEGAPRHAHQHNSTAGLPTDDNDMTSRHHAGSGVTGQHAGSGLTGQHAGSGLTGQHTGTGVTGQHAGSGLTGQHTGTGVTGQHAGSGLTGQHAGTGVTGQHNSSGLTGQHAGSGVTGTGTGVGSGTGYDQSTTTHQKPSMMDKLNPKKDADGDGKPGFMK